ncbi:MAG: hypothetical protein JNL32_16480, partial [Candidatus Kapabacteria bacterium]|nr:hypothetical protein [Candidatus Kapabacteria bacterium]
NDILLRGSNIINLTTGDSFDIRARVRSQNRYVMLQRGYLSVRYAANTGTHNNNSATADIFTY